jgi:hypothetical protein
LVVWPDFLQETPFLMVAASADDMTEVVDSNSPRTIVIKYGFALLGVLNICLSPFEKIIENSTAGMANIIKFFTAVYPITTCLSIYLPQNYLI